MSFHRRFRSSDFVVVRTTPPSSHSSSARLTQSSIPQGTPTAGVNVTTVQTTDVGRPLTLELWDFSGAPAYAEEVKKRLISGFFHAAVLCFSADDPAGLAAVEQEVRRPLHHTHTLCVVFHMADNVRGLVEADARAHADRMSAFSRDGVEERLAGG